MRICMIASTPFPPQEGIGFYIWNLSKQLHRWGHEVQIITRGGVQRTRHQVVDGIPIWWPTFVPTYPFHVHMHNVWVDRLVKQMEPEVDVFHLHTPLVKQPATKRPILVTVHTPMKADTAAVTADSLLGWLIKLQAPISYQIEQELFAHAAGLAAVSRSVARELRAYDIDSEQVKVLGNGVDTDFFRPEPEQGNGQAPYVGRGMSATMHVGRGMSATPHVDRGMSATPHIGRSMSATTHIGRSMSATTHVDRGMSATPHVGRGMSATMQENKRYALAVARLAPRKGLSDLIACAEIVLKRDPSFHFLIAGSGPMEHDLREEIRRRNLSEQVILLGHINSRARLLDLYRHAAIFVHPAHYEGLPTVLLEAMACGCPCITTAVSGALDVIEHEQNGLLVPPYAPEQMAESILRLNNQPEMTRQLGAAARQTVEERYSWEVVSGHYLTAYEAMM